MEPERNGSPLNHGLPRPRPNGRPWMLGVVGLLLGAALVWGAGPGGRAPFDRRFTWKTSPGWPRPPGPTPPGFFPRT